MKIPKSRKTYCKHCKSHTEHKVSSAKRRTAGSAHPLSACSKLRVRARGSWRGVGNNGRYSRPPMASRKMTGKKSSKKTDLRFTCQTCKKIHPQKQGKRTKRLELV